MNNDYDGSLGVLTTETWNSWDELGYNYDRQFLVEVEIDTESADKSEVTQTAVACLEKRQDEIRAALQKEITDLERRKAELLAIPYIGAT